MSVADNRPRVLTGPPTGAAVGRSTEANPIHGGMGKAPSKAPSMGNSIDGGMGKGLGLK